MSTNAETTDVQPAAANPLERSLDLVIAVADLDGDVAARLKKFARNAKLPGFRPGKVPASIIRQHYGEQAQNEAIGAAIERAFDQAVKDSGQRVAGMPRIAEKTSENPAELVFTATFEVFPEITLADMSAAEIERPELTVGDAEIDKTINILRKQRATYEAVERAAENGDRVVIDFAGKKDGEAFEGGSASDYPFVLGEKMMLPDFEAAVIGLKSGETRTFKLTFPADYAAANLAGQEVEFAVTVKRVSAPVLPEIDASFALALGIADGDTARMREEIAGNLRREVKKRLENRVKTQVMNALIAANPISVPSALVQSEINALAENAMNDLRERGVKTDKFPVAPEWFADEARRRVTLGLLIAEIVGKHDLKATSEKIDALVREQAESYEQPEEIVRWFYSRPELIQGFANIAVENNVVEWVLAQGKVSSKAIDFDELMGAAA